MVIKINDDRKLFDIQQDFNGVFPGLKLEFFSAPHSEDEPTPKRLRLGGESVVKMARKLHTNGFLSIDAGMTAYETEEAFRDLFGLNAQVFRRQGETWIETTRTDEWTLEKLNASASETNEAQTEEAPDYHEQE
jgi:hypothetical protein